MTVLYTERANDWRWTGAEAWNSVHMSHLMICKGKIDKKPQLHWKLDLPPEHKSSLYISNEHECPLHKNSEDPCIWARMVPSYGLWWSSPMGTDGPCLWTQMVPAYGHRWSPHKHTNQNWVLKLTWSTKTRLKHNIKAHISEIIRKRKK